MIDCIWERDGDRVRCTVCGKPHHRVIRRTCVKAVENMVDAMPAIQEAADRVGIPEKAKRYAAAMWRWSLAGFPVRSPEEVDRIYRECCEPCEHYDNGGCKLCGCCVSRKRLAIRNKLAMGTESCPIGRWSAL